MPTLQIDDHSIYYETHGQGDPLVLISGLGNSCLSWWKQIEPLSKKFRVTVLDNRGIGNSSRVSAAFTVQDMADDAATIIRALGSGPSYVAGTSMGGFIAFTLAVHHPERVKKLILVATSAGGPHHVPPRADILEIMNTDRSDIETYTRKLYTAMAGSGYMQRHPGDLDGIVRNTLQKPLSLETYLYQMSAINAYTARGEVDQTLRAITTPTMVIHGDADPLIPFPNGQYLADHIQGSKLMTYPGVGHLPYIETTDRFNKDVMAFLDGNGSPESRR